MSNSTASLFGMETELAVASTQAKSPSRIVSDLVKYAQKIPSLPAIEGGLFLENGARLYRDIGEHLEYSTPEVTTPDDLVAHFHAQEDILLAIASKLDYSIRMWRANVCYYNVDTTWASHESHLYTGVIHPDDLIPHLITRIIYAGSGGIDVSASLPAFSISPRAYFFQLAQSSETTHDRGIFNTRNESLSKGEYRRLHIIMGDTLCSQRANWLRMAITNLIVLLSSHGVRLASDIKMTDPIGTLKRICKDISCQSVPIQLVNGVVSNAIGIQKYYLEKIRDNLHEDYMPRWAARACNELEQTLNALESGPENVVTQLDWAMKYTLFNQYIEKYFETPFDISKPKFHSLSPDEKTQLIALRHKLAELDIRFGEYGPNGIFNTMDRDNLLDHQMVPKEKIQFAVENPPKDTRAKERGLWIKKLYMKNNANDIGVNWDKIIDYDKNRWLDLLSPFAKNVDWKDANHEEVLFNL